MIMEILIIILTILNIIGGVISMMAMARYYPLKTGLEYQWGNAFYWIFLIFLMVFSGFYFAGALLILKNYWQKNL